MATPESFDAFYARTVRAVTSQMHARADNPSEADHALREAFARAYQQWYEVSGYHDPESWVLGVATEAYERRVASLGDAEPPREVRTGTNLSTWPGIYRETRPAPEGHDLANGASQQAAAGRAAEGGLGGLSIGRPPAGTLPPWEVPARNQQDWNQEGWNQQDWTPPPDWNAQDWAAAGGLPTDGTASPGMAPGGMGSAGAIAGGAGPGGTEVGGTAAGSNAAGGTALGGAALGGAVPGGTAAPWNVGSAFAPGTAGADGFAGVGTAAAGAGANATIGLAIRDGVAPPDVAPDGAGRPGPPAGTPSLRRNGRGAGGLGLLRGRTGLVIAVVAAVIIAGVVYVATSGGHKAGPVAGNKGTTHQLHGKPQPTMLSAGHTGDRAAVPWSLVGPGWTLAEYSTAHADGSPGGGYTTYLVDPKGGKYLIRRLPASAARTLLAWSGDASMALFLSTPTGGQPSYNLLDVQTGRITGLSVPAGVFLTGFTQPKGLNLLAIHETPKQYQLRRYSLSGAFQANLAKSRRESDQPDDICESTCAAISSPNGLTDVWGVAGAEMELVSNAGGLIRKLHVPSSGKPPSCLPISWWNSTTVLADCAAPGQPDPGSQRLWLVPANGSAATPLTSAAGGSSGSGFIRGAWQTGGQVYVTQTTTQQCSSAASGPGGLGIERVAGDGSSSAVNVQGSTNNYNDIVAGIGGRLLVLSQTSCPGTSSLLSLDPATGASHPLLGARSGELGVVAATPYGAGATAYTSSPN
jgi:TolB protein